MSIFHRRLMALALLLPLALGSARSVAAHAELERAEPPPDSVVPASPPTLQLWFTETIEPGFSEVIVLDAGGQPAHTTRAQASPDSLALTLALPALPDGTYTVSWKNLSTVDGHTTRGFYALTVGQATAAPPGHVALAATPPPPAGPPVPLQALVRWLIFAGQALLVGGLLFGPLILVPALRSEALASARPALQQGHGRRAALQLGALVALGVAAVLALLVQTAIATERPLIETVGPPALQVATTTRYGLIWAARVVLLLLLTGLLIWLRRRPAAPRWASWLGIALGLALLLTTSLTSHGAATRGAAVLAVLADWLHLVATSAWLGGLAQLALVIAAVVVAAPKEARAPALSVLVNRFSTLALVCVGTLVATGVYGAFLHVDRLAALATTDYGRALVTKWLLLLPMLALAAVNLLGVRPALARATRAAGRVATALAATTRAGRTLTRSVRAELILGLLILAASGVLTSVAPALQTAAVTPGLTRTETAADLRLALRVTPAQPGENALELTVTRDGRPVDDVTRALVRLTFLDRELGETEVVLAPAGGGRYIAQGRQLSVVGQWQAELIVRRAGQDDARTAVRFPIPTDSAVASPTTTPAVSLPALSPTGLIALVILGLAGALVVTAVRLRRVATLSGALFGSGFGALALALYLLVTSGLSPAASTAATVRNPYPPTAQSLAQGRTLYTATCQVCHGVGGKGDGPQAATLQPPPLDLTVHVAFHTDADLFRFISQGMRGTAMPAFAGRLTEEQRWHLVNYIKTFASSGQTGQTVPTTAPGRPVRHVSPVPPRDRPMRSWSVLLRVFLLLPLILVSIGPVSAATPTPAVSLWCDHTRVGGPVG